MHIEATWAPIDYVLIVCTQVKGDANWLRIACRLATIERCLPANSHRISSSMELLRAAEAVDLETRPPSEAVYASTHRRFVERSDRPRDNHAGNVGTIEDDESYLRAGPLVFGPRVTTARSGTTTCSPRGFATPGAGKMTVSADNHRSLAYPYLPPGKETRECVYICVY